jgi:hypothetical protein
MALFPGQLNEDGMLIPTRILSSSNLRTRATPVIRPPPTPAAVASQAPRPPTPASPTSSGEEEVVNLLEEAYTTQDIEENVYVPVGDALELAFAVSTTLEPKSLAEAKVTLRHPHRRETYLPPKSVKKYNRLILLFIKVSDEIK